jgi:formate-dependent nitrite reductase membrane component NrfD
LLVAELTDIASSGALTLVGVIFILSLLAHLTILVFENLLSPSPTRHHELAVDAIRRGAYARLFWGGAIGAGGVLPLLLLLAGIAGAAGPSMLIIVAAALLALAGGAAWDYVWVDAGQSVPLS